MRLESRTPRAKLPVDFFVLVYGLVPEIAQTVKPTQKVIVLLGPLIEFGKEKLAPVAGAKVCQLLLLQSKICSYALVAQLEDDVI